MPALRLMLQIQYYAKNYAGIIGQTLFSSHLKLFLNRFNFPTLMRCKVRNNLRF